MSLKAEIKITDGGGNVVGVVDVDMVETQVEYAINGGRAENMVTDPETGKVHGFKFESKVAGQVAPNPPAQEVPVKAPEVPEFKVGDKAEVTGNNSDTAGEHGFGNGAIVSIVGARDMDGDYLCQGDRNSLWYVSEDDLRPVDAPQEPVQHFSVGDWVRLTQDSDDLTEGTVGRITRGQDEDGDYTVDSLDSWDYCPPSILEHAGDFRAGDKVRIVRRVNPIHYLTAGSVAEVISVPGHNLYVEGVSPDTGNPLRQTVKYEDVEFA